MCYGVYHKVVMIAARGLLLRDMLNSTPPTIHVIVGSHKMILPGIRYGDMSVAMHDMVAMHDILWSVPFILWLPR